MAYVDSGYWVSGYAVGDLTGDATAPGATLSADGVLSVGAASSIVLTSDAKFIARGAARNKTVTAAARHYQIATRSS